MRARLEAGRAVRDTLFPLPGSTARFSEDGVYRYELTRRWAKGPTATFIMLNPSTADAVKLDPTIRRCRSFAMSWRLGGLHVANLFAYRATDPHELLTAKDPIGPENDDAIHDAIVASRIVVVAWGAHPLTVDRAPRILELIHEAGRDPHCLGKTKRGRPRHPLYVRGDALPVPYEANGSNL